MAPFTMVVMPLVKKLWAPHGLKSYTISQLSSDQDKEYKYGVHAILEWESPEHFEAGLKADVAAQIFGDVPNFTDEKATLIRGPVVGSDKW
ncbi:hypothetical protein F5Y16DRAFT_400110 [Xylariaceae sp. FL0255]|nr:hypothetical protein F5Y16DRAFT_400110 [Xylariaceae sp. FL0255]